MEDARVEWTEPAIAVDRRIRACTPGPGAWSTWDGERIKLGPVRPVGRERLEPGLLEVTKNECSSAPPPVPSVSAGSSRSGRRRWTRRTGPAASGSSPAPGSGNFAAMAARDSLRWARPSDVDEICGGLPETWFGTSWGDVPTWLVPLRQGRQGPGFRAVPQAAPDRGGPADRRALRRPAGDPHSQRRRQAGARRGDGPFFTIDHFRGYNAVLVQQSRLGEITRDELAEVITDAWLATAPKKLVEEFLA